MFPIRDHNPSGRTPYVTYALMAVNILIFLGYYSLFDQPRALSLFYWDYALIPARVSAGEGFGGLVTSMFLHGGFMHLAGNMLFLFIFGDNIEDEMGHGKYLVFYLASGLAAALLQWVTAPGSMIPVVGASGAIAGVMGAYLLLYPRAKVDVFLFFIVFFRIIPVPAWIMLGLWFGLQIFGGLGTPGDQGGVAYWAHAGGFIAGIGLTLPLWLRLGGPRYWQKTDGHPPHDEAKYALARTSIPKTGKRRRGPWGSG